ncbi:MAG: TetR/AcrR family transcriptional regulator [Desulfomonilia bacterium]|uniref:Fatty acid metabolism regulator protein n=1 Tax=anaerobic digester metagenome TaxID=1263854 RepID=A0A485M4E0_9ZZZZ|nr:TetR/AcrR family transcriptional regulator [Pseudomonadota bacterium]HON39510.1 TetR/AcrR family transcriptional regulator [Deltaproteobacteria bacterium]HRS57231.1 TetR/AcrR family transcriptional regulator [Desulfomonilia bacterium]HPD22403.1 TetR/AcrR family transcriptional regulator [Deltaproteobacteria bacterium]HPX19135.1 TetR/AcrR family transcriptional regulator [Deltaproteobacteria bacterium]
MLSDEKKHVFPRLNDDQRKARRDAIIDAAEAIFAEKPFNKVNMRDIARLAGISPALIYRYFPNQQHLFIEAFLRGASDLIPALDNCIDTVQEDLIEKVAGIFIAYLTEHEQYFKMMTHFMLEGSINEDLQERLNTIERSVLDRFDRLFVKMGAKQDVRRLSHAFFAALNGILITYRRHPGRTVDEVCEHMRLVARIIARLFENEVRSGAVEK